MIVTLRALTIEEVDRMLSASYCRASCTKRIINAVWNPYKAETIPRRFDHDSYDKSNEGDCRRYEGVAAEICEVLGLLPLNALHF